MAEKKGTFADASPRGVFADLAYYFGGSAAREMRELVETNRALQKDNSALKGEGLARVEQDVDFREMTRYGDYWQQNVLTQYLGLYNPDEIPLSTYGKMRWDGQLRLGLMSVKMPIMSRSFWVDCKDKNIKAFVEQNMKEIWRPLIKGTLNAMDYGFAPFEKLWEVAEGYEVEDKKNNVNYTRDMIKYKELKDLCQNTITMNYSERMRYNGFWQNRFRRNSVFVPPEKTFVFTHDKEWGNIYGWSRLKPAYPYWYTYWILDAWHERWLQKRGIPPVIVRYPIGKSQTGQTGTTPVYTDNQQIARDAAKSFQPDSVVTMPSDTIKDASGKAVSTWNIETFLDNARIDAFVAAKEALDIRKLRAILIPERALTQSSNTVQAGTKMAESHIWIMMESVKGTIADIADHLNEFVIPQLVKLNFGDKAPRCTIAIEEIGRELTAALFEIYLAMVNNGNAHPSVQKMEELLSVPSETDEEKAAREKVEKASALAARVSGAGQPGSAVKPGKPGEPSPGAKGAAASVPAGAKANLATGDDLLSTGRGKTLAEKIWSGL